MRCAGCRQAAVAALCVGLLSVSGLGSIASAEAPKKFNPATATGARAAVAYYSEALLARPFEADPRARATCSRYLQTAIRTIDAEAGTPCGLRLRAQKAHAMCRWLAGDDAAALAAIDALATLQCGSAEGGLMAGLDLAERWWRPTLVHRYVAAQRKGAKARTARLERLAVVTRYVEDTRRALGKDYPRRGGGLLITDVPRGAPGSRAGLRRGDVIISLAARPVRRVSDINTHLTGRTSVQASVLYYRDGQRIEGAWPGSRASQLSGASLPERLP
jgi:hypothetical protein